ncbi:MAG TPA: hypothetical protein VFB26_01080, partial [Gaiellaceae bacterium]|nr:hypothetical protein [Gaiellaceae bacterium]
MRRATARRATARRHELGPARAAEARHEPPAAPGPDVTAPSRNGAAPGPLAAAPARSSRRRGWLVRRMLVLADVSGLGIAFALA